MNPHGRKSSQEQRGNQLSGIGAIKLCSQPTIIYINAFSELVKLPRVEKADLILVTHAEITLSLKNWLQARF